MAVETNRAGLVIPDGPYVYTLADADGVFYIGKGRGRRMFHHAKEALRGKPGTKCDRIRQALAMWWE